MRGIYNHINYITTDLEITKGKINVLENRIIPEDAYFKTATKVNRTIYRVLLLFIFIFAIVQVSVIVFLYMYYGEDKAFNEHIKLGVNLLGLVSAFELLAVPIGLGFFMKDIYSKINDIEKKLESL